MLRATPPGEDGIEKGGRDLYADAAKIPFANQPEDESAPERNYLQLVGQALTQGQTFVTQARVRDSWDRSIRAYRNEHFAGSKYGHKDFKLRSQIFRPKTRSAVRKDLAAAASALFSTTDAISCEPGDEGNPIQRASAAIIKELLNYRTDRTGGRAAIPWFRVSMGARQDAVMFGVCVTKQTWKLERKQIGEQPLLDPYGNAILDSETGMPVMKPEYKVLFDRPDITGIPLENIIIDLAADWLDPVQTAAFFIVKYPMRRFEIDAMRKHPTTPWKEVPWDQMRGADTAKTDSASVRQAREGGQDRFDQTVTGNGEFEVVWVHEVFIRIDGEDMQFWSVGSKHFLTDPTPVEEVYPAFGGDRPYTWGVANLEAHRLFPMSPVESWQPMQQEINDLANLRLDQVKLNVSPVAFVTRGRNVDIAALQRRGPNSVVLRQGEDDIEWDRPPEVPSSAYAEMERLNADFDDLAGQFNSGSVQTNRSMNETVGGLKLIAGNANVVGEFDLRTWIETWAEPTLGQVVKLLQYYEADATVLALCGERAKLRQKFGIDQITDELLQAQVTVRVNVGIGNGSPQERLGKFAGAMQLLSPMYANHPKVASGELEPDIEEISQEVFGLVGYRDGGKRFVKKGQPKQNPGQQLTLQKLMAEVKDKDAAAKLKTAQAANVQAKTQIETAQVVHGAMMDRAKLVHEGRAQREGFMRDKENDQHARQDRQADRAQRDKEMTLRQHAQANSEAAGAGTVEQSAPEAPEEQSGVLEQFMQLLQSPRQRQVEFVRGPDGRISGAKIIDNARGQD